MTKLRYGSPRQKGESPPSSPDAFRVARRWRMEVVGFCLALSEEALWRSRARADTGSPDAEPHAKVLAAHKCFPRRRPRASQAPLTKQKRHDGQSGLHATPDGVDYSLSRFGVTEQTWMMHGANSGLGAVYSQSRVSVAEQVLSDTLAALTVSALKSLYFLMVSFRKEVEVADLFRRSREMALRSLQSGVSRVPSQRGPRNAVRRRATVNARELSVEEAIRTLPCPRDCQAPTALQAPLAR